MTSYTKQIIDALHGILCDGSFEWGPEKSPTTGDTPWTTAINATLADRGKALGNIARYKGNPDGHGEWRWDHVWMDLDTEGNLTDVPMAAEYEMNASNGQFEHHQLPDFHKLLAARSRQRLFICQSTDKGQKSGNMDKVEKEENHLLDKLTERLKKYRWANEGEVFLIVVMRYRANPKFLKYRELVCGQAGWDFTDGERPCP